MSGVLIDGRMVHYESLGRGEPIVFVHGWLGSWRYWVPVMEVLSANYRTYALDLWGFGDSNKAQERYDVPTYVDLLVSFLDELGIGRVPVVGHTLGAAIAAELAARSGEWASRVLAVGMPLTAEAINPKLLAAGPNEVLARLFWHRQRPYPEVEAGLPKTARNAIALTVESVARLSLQRTLESIDVPLLGVYGARDTVINPQQADELESKHYTARAIILPDSYHFPMLDQPAVFARLVHDFVDVGSVHELRDLAIKGEWRRRTR
jgi:pimeloyl-ACP methyl ester carboxylesterase